MTHSPVFPSILGCASITLASLWTLDYNPNTIEFHQKFPSTTALRPTYGKMGESDHELNHVSTKLTHSHSLCYCATCQEWEIRIRNSLHMESDDCIPTHYLSGKWYTSMSDYHLVFFALARSAFISILLIANPTCTTNTHRNQKLTSWWKDTSNPVFNINFATLHILHLAWVHVSRSYIWKFHRLAYSEHPDNDIHPSIHPLWHL